MTNMEQMIIHFNEQSKSYSEMFAKQPQLTVEQFIDNDPQKISWSGGLKDAIRRSESFSFQEQFIATSMYRPYCKQHLYFSRRFVERVYQIPSLFPSARVELSNLVIMVTGIGASKDFSSLITDAIPNIHMHDTGQCFPLYIYEKQETLTDGLFADTQVEEDYVRKDAIPDTIPTEFRSVYDNAITKEDIFYYVYGILHSPEYKRRFAANLKKELPRIPFAQDFWAFSQAGRGLAQWHLNYETIEPYPITEFTPQMIVEPEEQYRVQKMRFGKNGKETDKTTIIYNSHLSLLDIPLEAYEYIVNGKSAIEWLIDRYQFKRDKASQITNDPNDWSDDPRYIVDLIKRIVRVSLETVKIVERLPALNEK